MAWSFILICNMLRGYRRSKVFLVGDEAGHLKHVGVEHSLLHLVEFISTDGIEIVTIELLSKHPGVDVLIEVTSNANVVVLKDLSVSFILELVCVREFFLSFGHHFFII